MKASSSHLPAGTVIAGKYSLEGLLGEGGMGAVYQATNLAIGRRVAIKILNAAVADREDVRRRFELEARAAAVVNHPGIVDVLDMGQTEEGDPFIVMEHLEGMTLRSLAKELQGLAPGQVVGVMVSVLEALAAAHRAGVIHRDVKPANIFVCSRPQVVKLLDFGVSRFGKSSGLTQTGNAIGTPRYMAPEQVLGEADLGPEADLYSVGAVLYSLLSGRPPHGAGSDLAMLARVLHDKPAALASVTTGLPPALCELVDSLLLKDRALRPRDAGLVRQALLDLGLEMDLNELFANAARGARAAALSPTPSVSQAQLQQVTGVPGAPRAATDAPTRAARPKRLEPVSSPRRGVFIAAAAVLLVGGGAGALLALRAEEPAVVPQPKPPPPTAVTVTVTLAAEPAEARIWVGGVELDCNPCQLTGEPGARRSVRVLAPGMTETSLELLLDRERTERVVLLAVPVAEPAPPEGLDAGTLSSRKKKPKKGGLSVDEKNPYE